MHQFNVIFFLIQVKCIFMDNLGDDASVFSDLLHHNFIVVQEIIFRDVPQSFHWEKYGFRLHCPQGAVPKDTEVAVTAIAGGNFKVPKGTMLVSAVYAISVSKPLLKPLVIELQHCVDLRTKAQTGCLKFVRAPLKYPYQFRPVKGGSFRVGKRYGSVKRSKFCLIAIVAEMSNGDTPSDSDDDYNTQPEGIVSPIINFMMYCCIVCIGSDDEDGGTATDHSQVAGEANMNTSENTTEEATCNSQSESVSFSPYFILYTTLTVSGIILGTLSIPSFEGQVKIKEDVDRGCYYSYNVLLIHNFTHAATQLTLSDVEYIGMMYHEERNVNHWKSMYTVVQDLDVLLEVHGTWVYIIMSIYTCSI